MWVLARAAAIAGLSILLMGSKLIIRVPEGGSVVSSSGLFACAAGEVCTIELDEQHFTETFTAVPAPGYAFNSWGSGAGAVCRGSHNPLCDELDTGPFSDFAGTASPLRGGGTLSMTPTFRTGRQSAGEPQARFSVHSIHRTRYYEVGGNTGAEVWAQLTGSANPLAVDHDAGTKPVGHASFHYQYDYERAQGASPSSCRVAAAAIEFRFETVLPELAAPAQLEEPLRTRWLPFQDAIRAHEAGHHAIYRQLVTRIPRVLAEIGDTPCGELAREVQVAVADVVGEVRRASEDYDSNYRDEHYVASFP